MARKMRKFSAGGAQGKYDRRMADIEKDFKKDSAGKSGKALEVLEAKRAQRKADAEDDRAKRTGADRTATRAAEKAAESNLTKTRKYGAAKSVTQDKPASEAKVTDSLPTPKMDSSIGKKSEAKPPVRRSAPVVRTNTGSGTPTSSTNTSAPKTDFRKVRGGSSSGSPTKPLPATPFNRQAFVDLKVAAERGKPVNSQNPKLARMRAIAEAPGASRAAVQDYRRAVESGMYKAKGGSVKKEKTMKYAKGGSTSSKPPQPTPAERAAGAKFRESIKNIKPTPAQGKTLEKTGKNLAKGGSACGMAKGGKATKFGAAMKKKSADTKGRAMMKFAKGGSIDGCATKGKTKGKMV